MDVSDFLGRLSGVKRRANYHLARCPAHDDKQASLSVGAGDDGRILLKCHAGCDAERIVGAMGLKLEDLFPPRESRQNGRGAARREERPPPTDPPPAAQEERQGKAKGKVKLGDPTAKYPYHDAEGRLVYVVLRFEPKGERKQFRQVRPPRPMKPGEQIPKSEWVWSLEGIERVLYRLPDIIRRRAEDPEEPILLVEGEKDADNLRELGYLATTSPQGAGKWQPQFAAQLEGLHVVIVPDNDDAGRAHAAAVAQSLAGRAARVRTLELPGLPVKGDVSDWIEQALAPGLLKASDLRARLDQLIADAPEWGTVKVGGEFAEAAELRRDHAARVLSYEVSFLDDMLGGILPTDLIILGAGTGAGKTTLGKIVAARAARAGRAVHYFPLEGHRGELHLRLLYQRIARLAFERGVPGAERLSYLRWRVGQVDDVAAPLERDAKAQLTRELATLRVHYRDRAFGVEDIERQFRAVEADADLIVFDHIHYVDTDDGNEGRALKRITKTLSDTALEISTPVIAIAHLRKKDARIRSIVPGIEEFHGTSDITKIATRVVVLAPAGRQGPIAQTYMAVQKDRLDGPSYVARCAFDLRTLEYRSAYDLGRVTRDEKGHEQWRELDPGEVPWWARYCGQLQQDLPL